MRHWVCALATLIGAVLVLDGPTVLADQPAAAANTPSQADSTTPGANATSPAATSTPGANTAANSAPAADDYQPTPAFPNQTRAPAPERASSFDVEVITAGLAQPWSLVFLPDGNMLVTERAGRMRTISRDGKVSEPVSNVPVVKAIAAEGLHDLVLHPEFARNRLLYFTYYAPLPNDSPPTAQGWADWVKRPAGTHESAPYGYERLARARLSRDQRSLEEVQTIFQGANRRIVFARDGKLFVTAAPPAGGGMPVDDEPQILKNLYGKVVRIDRDGQAPKDNPFAGQPDVRPEIYAYGLRDMEGATLHPETRELWTVEHGPRGGDEVNIIRPGRNYGFPRISYGREYSGALIHEGRTAQAGMEQPVYYWTPSIAPSGLLFYTGKLFPEWRNNLFVGAMAGKRLIRLVLNGERVVAEEPLLADRGKRIRDVKQGPDGAVYVLTAENNAELLRLTPKEKSRR
jgi:aldose sugar dehydrogenase